MGKVIVGIGCVFLFLFGCNFSVHSPDISKEFVSVDSGLVEVDSSLREDSAIVNELALFDSVVFFDSALSLTLEDIYISQVGVREATGRNDGKEVEMYLASVGFGKGYAWCAAFVHWCLDSAGIPNKITAWSPTAYNPKNIVMSKNGSFLKEPVSGDVFVLYYTNLKRIGHTGFFHRKQSNTIFESVEGNTNMAGSREGDGVYRKFRSFKATHAITRWE